MNASFLNDLTPHKSKWDSVLLCEHIGLIRGYQLIARQPYFPRESQDDARKQIDDLINNFVFWKDEHNVAYARRYK